MNDSRHFDMVAAECSIRVFNTEAGPLCCVAIVRFTGPVNCDNTIGHYSVAMPAKQLQVLLSLIKDAIDALPDPEHN